LRPGLVAFPVVLLLLACVVLTRDLVYQWRDAEALWSRALRYDPKNPVGHNNLGVILLDRGDLDEASEHFRQALRLRTGTNANASNHLALVLLWQGKFDAAAAYARQALERRPSLAVAHLNLGLARLGQGRPCEAVPSLRRTVELQPDRARPRFHLGYALNACGQSAAAEEEYREGLRLEPGWPEAINRIAWTEATSRQDHQRRGFEAVPFAAQAC